MAVTTGNVELKLTPYQTMQLALGGSVGAQTPSLRDVADAIEASAQARRGVVLAVDVDQFAAIAQAGSRYDLTHRTDLFGDVAEKFVDVLCAANPRM